MDGNHIILADEYINLTGCGHPIPLVIHRKVKHDEKMVRILIDFWALHSAQHIVQIEEMKVELFS
jgi:hypothetical protein